MNHTQEVRDRIAEASKLRWADPEYRKRLEESHKRAVVRRRAEWARKARSAAKLKCENCASEFVPKVKRGSNAQKYCSERCRDTAYMRRKRSKPEYAAKTRERWANDPEFREARLTVARRWRERHPEKAKAATLQWVSNNREHLAEYQRGRRKKDPEKFRQQQRDYYHRLRNAARRKTPGAKRNPLFAEAHRLRKNAPPVSWSRIAIKLLPDEYRNDAERTIDKLKKGVRYLRKANGEA